jgi:hypothetical protein
MRNDVGIIRLKEISPNNWLAKYQGNYGVYTIKITTDGEKTTKFSCSCPSDYYPCKHIAMIKDAIDERVTQQNNNVAEVAEVAEKEVKLETNSIVAKLLRNVPQEKLYKFLVQQASGNKKLTNTILIEFADNVTENYKNNCNNPYSVILRETLRNTKVRNENYYRYENRDGIEIEAFDQILIKLKKYFDQKNYHEVVLICKACIEELSKWLMKKSRKFDDIFEFIDYEYFDIPFKLLGDIVENSRVDLNELYDYCRSEIRNSKYEGIGIFTKFNDLFLKLSLKVNPNGFIEFQDELLSKVQNKKSHQAEIILKRKFDLYNLNNQPNKAQEIIEENIQIESFCKKLVKTKIQEQKFTEAKKLINDYLNDNDKNNNNRSTLEWDKLLLEIAQKQNDKQTTREIAFQFINKNFNAEYFKIYKSTFNNKEWKKSFEQLLICYDRTINKDVSSFNYWGTTDVYALYDLLVAENKIEMLMEFVEKHLTVNLIERYYKNLVDKFPTKTLLLFRKALDNYIKDSLGRETYEYLAKMLTKMQQINGGKEIVKDMVKQYRTLYKNRRTMQKILSQF